MKILGIETSCDETAAAVVSNGREVLSNIVVSSLKEHARYGGIIPEIASRRQLECIHAICDRALTAANCQMAGISAIAVTEKPGLIGSLLVGLSFARALSAATGKPLIPVDHIKAHVHANFLEQPWAKTRSGTARLPAIALVVSGGHTVLYHVKGFTQYRLLGRTRDDAAGEAFDKVAKILDLGYPGGPAIDRSAKKGEGRTPRFRCADLPDTYDFSFSGIKTAVLYYCREHKKNPSFSVRNVAYAFQDSVNSSLVQKAFTACRKLKVRTLLIGGGVAANSDLREKLLGQAGPSGISVHFPSFDLCTDNAAMIAGLGYHLIRERRRR